MPETSLISPEDQGATFVELFFDLVEVGVDGGAPVEVDCYAAAGDARLVRRLVAVHFAYFTGSPCYRRSVT
jgi:hypothetical protein